VSDCKLSAIEYAILDMKFRKGKDYVLMVVNPDLVDDIIEKKTAENVKVFQVKSEMVMGNIAEEVVWIRLFYVGKHFAVLTVEDDYTDNITWKRSFVVQKFAFAGDREEVEEIFNRFKVNEKAVDEINNLYLRR